MYVTKEICTFVFQAKVVIAEQTEKDIDETRSLYIPVAVRTQILFFCTYDLVSSVCVVVFQSTWRSCDRHLLGVTLTVCKRHGKYSMCILDF